MDNIPLQSPLAEFCYRMDKKLINKTIYDYYDLVDKIESKYLTNLIQEDFRYRYYNQLNYLIEICGGQGSGKSLFGQHLAIMGGKIYNKPFDMKKHTVADLDILNNILKNTPFRTTFIVDEQPLSFFGHGTIRVVRSLRDFEEICRYTMKNVIYISPSEREHSSYYVFKEDAKNSVERFRNEECLKCPKQKDCLKIFTESKFQTLCEIPFWQRHGYPVAFNFMLTYPRKSDNHLMPRGYVRFPVLSPELMKEYDKIKKKNLEIFEQNQSEGWKHQRKKLQEFKEEYYDKLITDKGKVKSKTLIEIYLKDHYGGRTFTIKELTEFATIIQTEITEELNEKAKG